MYLDRSNARLDVETTGETYNNATIDSAKNVVEHKEYSEAM